MRQLIAILLGLTICFPSVANGMEIRNIEEYYEAIEEDKRIYDFAGLLDHSDEETLEERIAEAEELVRMDLVILTVDQMFGRTQQGMADDFFDEGDFGYEENIAHGSGILLLIDTENRQLYISTAGLGILYYHDEILDTILEDIAPGATAGEYQRVCEEFIQDVIYYGKTAASTKAYSDIGKLWYTGQYGDYQDLYRDHQREIDRIIGDDYDRYPKHTFFTLFRNVWIDLLIGIFVAGIFVMAAKNHKTSEHTAVSSTYRKGKEMELSLKTDAFLRRSTMSKKIESSSVSGSKSGSFHHSSSGSSHGGRGRGF